MVFHTMFERATAFSAILVFLSFNIVGLRYLDLMQSKNQEEPTPVTSSKSLF